MKSIKILTAALTLVTIINSSDAQTFNRLNEKRKFTSTITVGASNHILDLITVNKETMSALNYIDYTHAIGQRNNLTASLLIQDNSFDQGLKLGFAFTHNGCQRPNFEYYFGGKASLSYGTTSYFYSDEDDSKEKVRPGLRFVHGINWYFTKQIGLKVESEHTFMIFPENINIGIITRF